MSPPFDPKCSTQHVYYLRRLMLRCCCCIANVEPRPQCWQVAKCLIVAARLHHTNPLASHHISTRHYHLSIVATYCDHT
ncbi:MAG: hypothetical protein MHMPM18_000111 [Marteilia pararefringens]